MMYYARLKNDRHNRRWKVREAVSLVKAVGEINFAMATGSVGGRSVLTTIARDGSRHEQVLADIVRVNSDNTEAQPYQAAY